jgi:hypothetical protein
MLTEGQAASWRRLRAKGRTRVILEQGLTWTLVGIGGPTLRAAIRGGREAVVAYWSGDAVLWHLGLALLLGAAMAYLFGALAWKRMERLAAAAPAKGPPRKQADG